MLTCFLTMLIFRQNYALRKLSHLLEIVVDIVSLFFFCKLVLGIDNLTVVPLSVIYVLGSTHNGNVYLTAAGDNVIPVDEVNVSEETEVKLTVLDGKSFASTKEN